MVFETLFGKKTKMPTAETALSGREGYAFAIPETHEVLGTKITPPYPDGLEIADFALGCFWGAERLFWELPGVWTTAVGYEGGFTPYPTYEETCTGKTGHAETVRVVFDPAKIPYDTLVKEFFEAHDPTQGMRQGNDVGTQYRSAIFTSSPEQQATAEAAKAAYDAALQAKGYPAVTTEIIPASAFYFAEDYHQQYLHKVPNGYCGLAGTGVSCVIPRSQREAEEPAHDLAPVSGGAQADAEPVSAPDTGDDPGLKPLPTSEEEWKQVLGPDQYRVLRQAGTERPFTGHYNAVWDEGTYRCAACGNPLFDSSTKFDHGCGWPSFGEALPGAVEYIEDRSHGMVRTEVRCARCHSHLGHVFNDGPREFDGARFCMNSIAINLDQSGQSA
ncbi:MAG: peptide-methionine (S)-S-oxide reductase MsrA [Thermomicrobiales bacterium]